MKNPRHSFAKNLPLRTENQFPDPLIPESFADIEQNDCDSYSMQLKGLILWLVIQTKVATRTRKAKLRKFYG
jgi:hypothetical protein